MKIAHLIVMAAVGGTPVSSGALPTADEKRARIGRAMVTYYWIVDEADPRYPRRDETVVRDVRGRVIARTSKKFKRDLAMEGTGWLRPPDGRTVTYEREVNGDSRFRITQSRYGNGIGRCRLVPYRTIAVNPNFLQLGSKVYIPALKGARLPDGTVHDGMVVANDKAPFSGAHIDVFAGVGARAAKPFIRRGVRSRSHVTLYLAGKPDRRGCHAR